MVCGFCRHGFPWGAHVCAACGATIIYGPVLTDVLKWATIGLALLLALIVAVQAASRNAPLPGWQLAFGVGIAGGLYGRWRHRRSVRFRRYLH